MQKAYLDEMLARQQKELNEVLGMIYEDLGIAEKILQAPPGTFVLRKDFSGLDIMPAIAVPKIETPEPPKDPKKPASGKEPETRGTLKDKSKKDH